MCSFPCDVFMFDDFDQFLINHRSICITGFEPKGSSFEVTRLFRTYRYMIF